MRFLSKLIFKLLFPFILLGALILFIVTTTAGLDLTIRIADLILPGEFYVENPQGRLIDSFSFSRFNYKNEKLELKLTNLRLKWRWESLFKYQIFIEQLAVSSLELIPKKKNPRFKLPRLPDNLHFGSVDIDKIQLDLTALKSPLLEPKLEGSLHYQNHQLKAELNLGKNQLVLSGSPSTQWQLKAFVPEPKLLHPQLKGLQTTLSAEANLSSVNSGIATLTIQPGTYQFNDDRALKPLAFKGGQIQAEFNAGKLKINGQLALDESKIIELKPIQINLQSLNKNWDIKGAVKLQKQSLNLSGKGEFFPEPKGTISIDSTQFRLLETKEYLINLAPQLVLNFTPKLLDISGTILVPSAQIKPQSFENTINLSSDVVFVKEKPTSAPNPFPIRTDIRLEMGPEVALHFKGLQGFLSGSLLLHQNPGEPLQANGELTIRKAKYKAYGQDLNVDQGQLIFTGGLIDNPDINLRASRNFSSSSSLAKTSQFLDFNSANLQTLDFGENTKVGILVTGRLKSPKIELFSEPSTLSQADILSMLILGKPASQANQAGGQLLLKALTSMNLGAGSRGIELIEQLKQTIDVDIDVKTNTRIDQQTRQISETNSVVVGKSLTKRIYLSYNFGLADSDPNVVTLTYLLSKFFSLQVNASLNASSIDLLYTRKKDKSP